MTGLFEKKQLKYNLRDSDLITQSKFNTFTYGYKSFSYYGAKIWNALSPDIKRSDTLSLFKSKLKCWCKGSAARNLSMFWLKYMSSYDSLLFYTVYSSHGKLCIVLLFVFICFYCILCIYIVVVHWLLCNHCYLLNVYDCK